MSLITPADLRARDSEVTPEAISDDGLQSIIDTNEAEIVRLFGDHARMVESLSGDVHLFPSRRVGAIVSISEAVYDVTTALVAADWSLLDGGRTIRRAHVGATNPRSTWGVATVEYVPLDDVQVRVGVLVALCQIDLRPAGLQSRAMGSWREEYSGGQGSSREEQRTAVLRRLAPAMVIG